MKIAIAAASGQLGSAVVKALLQFTPSHQVVALARTVERAMSLGVEVRPGDYNQQAQLEKSLQDIDTLLMVTSMSHADERMIQHRNVITAAQRAGVRKIVYTSIQGAEHDTAFSPVVQSNRKTELMLQQSGLDWVIGRNGIYIEPDVEYLNEYVAAGEVANSAGDGLCSYTTRDELAYAYAKLLTDDKHNGQIYNLNGQPMSQYQLVRYLNETFNTHLVYVPMDTEAFRLSRIPELGDFLGNVVGGIYESIQTNQLNNESQFYAAAGRQHITWDEYFQRLKS
ncbi:NAD(P)H-binding protein [Vibrio sp. Vb2880]|uniref:NAD(P)H-binding protein n=1 Tax=Vibrio sp. Vb2880 TaxID=2816076 RepID=UPI001A8CEAE8|nr:NAD(P)H-binding protein [Vibrio sp. Vb2880]MBO0212826.1 NAD(P)H-binding protein [Vibrio sp. Vb2880]